MEPQQQFIPAVCFTNLDDYRCHVNKFYVLPQKGDSVQVIKKGQNQYLKVSAIYHSLDKNNNPQIRIELHY